MDTFLDIKEESLTKAGELLCGDKVKILRSGDKTIVVLSDGLGSGVKANILATLTTEILITMLDADVRLEEVIGTVIGTLPTCKVRNVAYATFTVIKVNHSTQTFKVINFDNPPIFYFRRRKALKVDRGIQEILGRKVTVFEGALEMGDFLAAISDGVLYAGMGVEMNFGWGWENIAKYVEGRFITHYGSANEIVADVVGKTRALYGGKPGDDATMVGIYVREKKSLMVFTGPPLEKDQDFEIAERLVQFNGTKVVCGGTTANIVAQFLARKIVTEIASLRKDVPPIGKLDGVDLVTEGILTMSKALEYMRDAGGNPARLPRDRNGAVLLAWEFLKADAIDFVVGQQINEFYQNPLLPKTISIRKNLVQEIAAFLTALRKEVRIEFV